MHRFHPLCAALTAFLLIGLAAPARAQAPAPAGTPVGTPTGTIEVVAFGDSLSAGYGVGPGDSFPEQLQAALRAKGYDVAVANGGVSGDTSSGGLARIDWSVPPEADLVILEFGANDALRGVSPALTRRNLDAMLEHLARRGTAAIVAGMIAPPNMGPDYAAAFNPIYAALAAKHEVPLYPFFLDGVAADPALNQDDHMHPNPKGVAVIVARMLPAVMKELDRLKGAPPAPAGKS